MSSRIPAVGIVGIVFVALPLLLSLSSSSGQSSFAAKPRVPAVFNPGPDLITGDIGEAGGLAQFGTSGTQVGLGMSTTGCNAGDHLVNFFAMPSTNHPVIPHNLYRMSGGTNNNDRFEQIGQSWVKHAFGAAQLDRCYVCNSGGDLNHLGVGCSDTYAADQNAAQSDLGSRALINPFTGVFQSNARDHTGHVHNGTSHRVLVEASDVDTAQNSGATYYAEVQYISSDEYAWCQGHPGECNMYNNASYRRFNVSGTTSFTFTPAGNAVRMAAAINAWTGATINPIEPAPGIDGRAFIAYKVTGPVAGIWHYEYAIYNENLDRAIQSFSIPLGCAITLTNLGFHAPLNHPGFPNDGTQGDAGFSNAPWSSNQTVSEVSWSSETFAQNQNANAIRWGTLYNFRFDSDRSPLLIQATIGFFKTGTPVTVGVMGPNACNVVPSPTPPPSTATPTATPAPTPTPVTVPTPLQPPGANGKIAYARAGEIYLMNADGGSPINITNAPMPADSSPAWSPDGNKIAFESDRSGHKYIYVMNANGANPTRLGMPGRSHPRWSPDGARIACDDTSNIYVMNANGTNEVSLTQTSSLLSCNLPVWSPDGGKIAFVGRSGGRFANIYVINADGSNLTNLTDSPTEDAQPAWSPDGTRIAYVKEGGIFVMSAYGTNRILLPNTAECSDPEWSPDGTKILFSRNGEINVMNADGSNQINLTNTSFAEYMPSWQRIEPPVSTPAQAINLSTRMRVQTGDNVGIGGLIITGSGSKHVLLRAIGPSLAQFGIPNALADPTLELVGSDSTPIASNNNWRDTQEAAIQASGLAPTNNFESAIDVTLSAGSYTAVLKGNGDATGVAVIEAYDLTPSAGKLGNISTRSLVGVGSDIAIAGFILGSNTSSDRVVIRGIGPSLASAGVANPLPDPMLELRDGNGGLLMANNNWQDDSAQATELTNAGLAPANSLESGIAATLPPGLYTALLSGQGNGAGVGLVEVYDRGQ
jgi:hypothetical protein